MKNKSKEVPDSDDSDLIDDPSPILSLESTHLDKSVIEKYLCDSAKKSNNEGNEAELIVSNKDDSSKTSADKLVKKKNKSTLEVHVAAKKKSIRNDAEHVQATFNAEGLSSDDEVYIFHCPENFKMHNLLNQKINISKSKQFVQTEDGEKYQLKILDSDKQMTLAVPEKSSGGKLVNLPLKGHMIIQKTFQVENYSTNDLVEGEETTVFPDDIKIRHPFLGVDWKSYIDSAREAIEKNKFNKKMKKKIKKERTEEIVDVKNKKIQKKFV